MIVVHVELWPRGDHSARRVIAVGIICNDGEGTAEIGNYDARFTPQVTNGIGPDEVYQLNLEAMLQPASIDGWPRQRRNVWQLLHALLGRAFKSWSIPWTVRQASEAKQVGTRPKPITTRNAFEERN